MTKLISILGSTGSIGVNALKVVDHLGGEVEVAGLAAGSNAARLLSQIQRYRPKVVGLADLKQAPWLQRRVAKLKGRKPRLVFGPDSLSAVATEPSVRIVLTSVVGSAGLIPTLQAIRAGKDIALANKETLVAAGELVSREARKAKVRLIPVDSEHSAIFQCLAGLGEKREVRRIILTASGGPFKNHSRAALQKVTRQEALNHPTWNMGPKITVDSATLMNKGLEVIEAHWLFGLDFDHISVVVHPQSIIHSMVEAVDGSILAQLGPADMRLPIQYALTFPRRVRNPAALLDFLALSPLTFEAPRLADFPCLALAYKAGRMGGTAPAVLNAANEAAVAAFLAGRIGFTAIPRLLAKSLGTHRLLKDPDLADLVSADAWARRHIEEQLHAA
jgi:1-deoxy-D-xylulose-5-phosphate reductoisomerase